jgi:hypothetical protein
MTGVTGGDTGVSLEHLAVVHAAVAAGFTREAVLAVEGLDPAGWDEVEAVWSARLAESHQLLARYRAALAEHQDRLGRPVAPLEDDLGAWVTLLKVYEKSDDAGALLASAGLVQSDMGRLERRWRERFLSKPELGRRAARLAAAVEQRVTKGEQLVLPRIVVGTARLEPSSMARRTPGPQQSAEQRTISPVLGIERFAMVRVDLETFGPSDRADVLTRHGVDETEWAAIEAAWRMRLESDAEVRGDFRVLTEHYRQTARLRMATEPGRSAGMQGSPLTVPLVPTTHATDVDATGEVIVTLRDTPALPFVVAVEPPPAPTTDETAFLTFSFVPIDALPFDASSVTAAPAPAATTPGGVDATGEVIRELRMSPVLPFTSSVPTSDAPAGYQPRIDRGVDATSDVIPALLDAPALPFGDALDDGSAVDRTTFMARPVLEAVAPAPSADEAVRVPFLSLEQYAALCAECAAAGDGAPEVERRYHVVDSRARRTLDEHWERRMLAEPQVRARFTQLLAHYQPWFARPVVRR